MADIAQLNIQEKIFLAGCIKALFLANDEISDDELDDLDRITDVLAFPDFDECLAEFERNVHSEEEFAYLAKNIYHEGTQSIITQILWDLALHHGYAKPAEEVVIRQLQTWWKE